MIGRIKVKEGDAKKGAGLPAPFFVTEALCGKLEGHTGELGATGLRGELDPFATLMTRSG